MSPFLCNAHHRMLKSQASLSYGDYLHQPRLPATTLSLRPKKILFASLKMNVPEHQFLLSRLSSWLLLQLRHL